MSRLPNRRDDEVRRLLDTPHPVVPIDLAARAMVRGRRIVRRRRTTYTVLWALLLAAAVAGIVLAVMTWPNPTTSSVPTDGPLWTPSG